MKTYGEAPASVAHVDYSIAGVLITFTMFLVINGGDQTTIKAAAVTTAIFVGTALIRHFTNSMRSDP